MSDHDRAVSIDLYDEGIVIAGKLSQIFVQFNEDNGEIKYNVSKDVQKYINKNPIYSIQMPLIIGILKIQFGYLICASEISKITDISNLQINRIDRTVLIPLNFELASKIFQDWLNGDPVAESRDSRDSSRDNVEEDVDQEMEDKSVPMTNENNIFFTKIGILTQSFKATPLIGVNETGTINHDHLDLFDIEIVKSRNEEDIKRIRAVTFNNETSNGVSSVYNKISEHETDLNISYKHISPKFISKLLRNVVKFFNKGGFYFSYDVNIVGKITYDKGSFTPLLENLNDIKSDFFWNRDLVADFLKIMDSLDIVFPIIQGYVSGIKINNIMTEIEEENKEETVIDDTKLTFNFNRLANNLKDTFKKIEAEFEEPMGKRNGEILLMSKRSSKRCGVRYLRRGIDDDSNVANFIQTSQMLIVPDLNIFTNYDIIRGSIPAFFEQDPSKLQPQPKITRSVKQCGTALLRHYQNLQEHYQDITSISLIEKKRKEQELGELFEHLMIENHLKFVWFDFHDVCKNMKFENINYLLDQDIENDLIKVRDQLEVYKWCDNETNQQNGIFRINCVDCLDRTNIICKFLNQQVLNKQLRHFKLVNNDTNFNYKFSDLWANNGDSISQQYCSTNAMKGDFTRTNKRNYKGLISDAILSLTRYYYNSVTDFFNQFIIDYLLYHNHNDLNFLENFESLLENFDPNVNNSANLQKKLVMANIVKIFEKDGVLGSWWVKSCFELNKYLQYQTELDDCILLLTRSHLILIHLDLENNKLVHYKLNNGSITTVQYGHFFSSIYTANDKNPKKNIGLRIEFKSFTRFENDIVSNIEDDSITIDLVPCEDPPTCDITEDFNFFAIKFDPVQMSYNDCRLAIRLIFNVCYRSQLLKKDLVTFDEAKKSGSILKNIDHKMKKFIWG